MNQVDCINILIMNCIVISKRKRGGTERRLVEVVKHFCENGIKPHVLEYSQYPLAKWNNVGTVTRVRRLFQEGMIGDILRVIVLTPILFRMCLKQQIEALYVNRADSTENLAPAFLVSRIMRKPIILIAHDVPEDRKLPIAELMSKWRKKGFGWKLLFSKLVTVYLNRYMHANAELGLAVSLTTAKEFIEFVNPHVYFVGNGVDLEKFTPDFNANKVYDACYLGRIEKSQKNIDVLLKCWRIVADSLPKSKLCIIGEGSNKYTSYCRDLVKQLSLENNVIFTGWVDDDIAIRLLRSSKLFILSSKVEGFALAVLEAMACGLTCIISDIPVLRENFAGVAEFADPEDPEKFSEHVIYYLVNEDRRIRMGQAAYKHANNFKWKDVALRETQLIRHVTGKNHRKIL